jgi:hypothetical protein
MQYNPKAQRRQNIAKLPNSSRRQTAAEKVTYKQQYSKVYRENKKLKKENRRLKTQLEKYRKRYYRLLQKQKGPPSPRRQVKQIVKGRNIPRDIEKKLLQHTVLETQLKEKYQRHKNYKDKDIFGRILSGKVIKKYRQISYIKNFAPKRFMKEKNENPDCLQYRSFRGVPLARDKLKADVTQFLEEDENSRMTSGVKETITRQGVKKQRRYLLKSMQDLHSEFLAKHGYKISYASFCQHRPFWVMFPRADQRETCACKTHENFSLILEKLHHEKVILQKSSKIFISHITCNMENADCALKRCTDCKEKPLPLLPHDETKVIKWFQWESTTEEYTEIDNGELVTKTAKKQKKKESTGTVKELLNLLMRQLPKYLKHVFYMTHQFKTMKDKRTTLMSEELYIWVDWAENWTTKLCRETQSVHFGGSREQFSLHTAVCYSEQATESFCTVSICRQHGPPEIMAHLKSLVSAKMEQASVKHIHFQSDSPLTQYRCRAMFAYLVEVFPHIFPNVESFTWNYSEAGHGKGPVDGVGARLKGAADDEVAHGKDVDSFEKFVDCCNKVKNVKTIVVTLEEIQIMQSTKVNPKQFKGTLSVHQVTWARANPKALYLNCLSCFQCNPGTKCKHFNLGSMSFDGEQTAQEEQAIDDPEPQESPVFRKGDWVAITLSGQKYPG